MVWRPHHVAVLASALVPASEAARRSHKGDTGVRVAWEGLAAVTAADVGVEPAHSRGKLWAAPAEEGGVAVWFGGW